MRRDSDIEIVLVHDGRSADDRCESDVQSFRDKVHRWTGNHPLVIIYRRAEIPGTRDTEPVLADHRRGRGARRKRIPILKGHQSAMSPRELLVPLERLLAMK